MTIYTLSHGSLKLDVSDQGGVIEGFWRDTTPLLRPGKKSGVATDASCFPLVPFANRVSGNRFVWQGREYQLQPNVEWDAHYLHGDGWLGEWQCVSHSDDSLCLVYLNRNKIPRLPAHPITSHILSAFLHLESARATAQLKTQDPIKSRI